MELFNGNKVLYACDSNHYRLWFLCPIMLKLNIKKAMGFREIKRKYNVIIKTKHILTYKSYI